MVAGAAAGTMSDVVGFDGAWVSDFADQGAITDLSAVMTEAGYDESQLASQVQVDGKTYMIPVVNFVYPMFTNDDLPAQAGVHRPPTARSSRTPPPRSPRRQPTAGSSRCRSRRPTGSRTTSCPVWASGGSMLKDGQPALTDNEDVTSATDYIQGLWDAGVIAPGSFTMKEQDKVEEFSNGRVGMMIDSLAHVNLIRESNPDLNFSISAIPAEDDYTGERGIPYASWGIGIAENSEHKAEAFKLVEFLMSEESTASCRRSPTRSPATRPPSHFVEEDELFATAFEIYQSGSRPTSSPACPWPSSSCATSARSSRRRSTASSRCRTRSPRPRPSGKRSSRPPARNARAARGHDRRGPPPGESPVSMSQTTTPAEARPSRPPRPRRRLRPDAHDRPDQAHATPYGFLSPTGVLLIILMVTPIIMVVSYSLLDRVITNKNPAFVGFENYVEVLTDPVFFTAVRNTLVFTISSVVVHFVIGLAFAPC